MFTGIVEEIGKIISVKKGASSAVLTIACEKIMEDVNLGDSIAVNGVCLTVSSFTNNTFTADVMHETLNRSSLSLLSSGSPVNLERAMPAYGRFGGHIVSGHIDGVGTIINKKRDDNAIWITISAPKEIIKYIVQKGSIAIDGVSLTIADLQDDSFSVSLIPHTAGHTIFPQKPIGQLVNLENDIIGKYVERLLKVGSDSDQQIKSNITMDFLIKNGF